MDSSASAPTAEHPRTCHELAKRAKQEDSSHSRCALMTVERVHDEPAKRVKLEDSGRAVPAATVEKADNDRSDKDEEYDEDVDGEDERELAPEALLAFEFADAMKTVEHEPQHGIYAPPARASSGCAYAVHNSAATPLPQNGVVSGTLRLSDVPGSRLEYAVSLEVGLMLECELYDERSGNGFVRFAHVMDMYETIVPASQRGKGHAKRLVRAAFAVAHAYGFRVRPSCTYISETFLAARPAEEYDVWYGRRCDELLLFSCCPEGKALEGRRRQLARLPMAELNSRCEEAGAKIGGAKYLMVERLLGLEFGTAAARRFSAFAGQETCRARKGLGCGGCRACRGDGRAGWVGISDELGDPPPPTLVRRRRADEHPHPERVPPHERCVLFNCGPESAEWGPPAYMADGFAYIARRP